MALCHCGHNKTAAFEEHHVPTTRSEGQRLKYAQNRVSWRWLNYIGAEKVLLHLFTMQKHSAVCVASCPIVIFILFILFSFFKKGLFHFFVHWLFFFSCYFRVSSVSKVTNRMRHYAQLSKKCSLMTLKCSNASIKLSNISFGHLSWLLDFIYSTSSPSHPNFPSVKYFLLLL